MRNIIIENVGLTFIAIAILVGLGYWAGASSVDCEAPVFTGVEDRFNVNQVNLVSNLGNPDVACLREERNRDVFDGVFICEGRIFPFITHQEVQYPVVESVQCVCLGVDRVDWIPESMLINYGLLT